MTKLDIVKEYFASWLRQDRAIFDSIFADDAVYTECYGPEYHGLQQLKHWFDEWNTRGRVLEWSIKASYCDGDTLIAEWYFSCDYEETISGFDGVSLIRFSPEGKIVQVKEFESKAEHYFPFGRCG